MPPLTNVKHEVIANQVAKGKSWENALLVAGFSATTARTQHGRMSKNVGILSRIVELRAQIADKSTWDAARVLKHLGDIVELDEGDLYDDQGRPKPIKEWPPLWRKVGVRVESETKMQHSQDGGDASWDPEAQVTRVIAMAASERLKALELLGKTKVIDAFVKQGGTIDININVAEKVSQALNDGRQRASQLRLVG